MNIEGVDGRGSMYGVVDGLRNMTAALESLLEFLPENFVWPTICQASPFSVYAEWGRDDTTQRDEEGYGSVWLIANPEGVMMNADFRPGWPGCGASPFDAKEAAAWLLELTQNWQWDASRSGGKMGSSLQKAPRPVNTE